MLLKSTIIRKIYKKLTDHYWEVGFVDFNLNDIIYYNDLKIKFIKHNFKNKWFADPFVLNITDEEIILLVEEYDSKVKKGRIAKLIIDRKSLFVKSLKIILELSTHLSFPLIYYFGKDVFICPENSASGCFNLYKYNIKNDNVIFISKLSDYPLTDAIFVKDQSDRFENSFLLSTCLPNPNGKELGYYKFDNCYDKFFYFKSILFEDNIARNAGNVFELKSEIYRPAQVCNGGYGMGISLQKMVEIGGEIIFKEIKRFYPQPPWTGLHTFNVYNNFLVAVDARKFKYHNIAKAMIYLAKIAKTKNNNYL